MNIYRVSKDGSKVLLTEKGTFKYWKGLTDKATSKSACSSSGFQLPLSRFINSNTFMSITRSGKKYMFIKC